MTDNPAAIALQLESTASQLRFVRAVAANTDESTLHLYEHRNGSYSIHGDVDVPLAAQLAPGDFRGVCELPAAPPVVTSPLSTLHFNKRMASELVALALFQGGKRVSLFMVQADGRTSQKMEGSPAILGELEDEFLDGRMNQRTQLDDGTVMAIKVGTEKGMTVVGCAVWDPTRRRLWLGDLYDNESFSNLESALVSMSVMEAVLCQNNLSGFEKAKIDEVLQGAGIVLTELQKSLFNVDGVDRLLEGLIGSKVRISKFLDLRMSCSACAGLIQYLQLSKDQALMGNVRLSELGSTHFMHVDNNVMRALNVMPFPGDGGKKGSIYGLLNVTMSVMGSRLLKKWLSQPLQNVDDINRRLDTTDALKDSWECCDDLRKRHLTQIPDLTYLCKRFTSTRPKANLRDVVRLYQCSVRMPFMCECLEGSENYNILKDKFVDPLRKLHSELGNFEALVETTIDLDRIDNGEFAVDPRIDPELKVIRDKQVEILAKIKNEHDHVQMSISGLKNDSLKLERKDNLGYFFRVTRTQEKFIRGKGFHLLETRKDGVRFQTKKLKRLSEAYVSLAAEYEEKEHLMREKTLEVATTYVDIFIDLSAILSELDVMCAFAFIARTSKPDYTRPVMKPAGSGLLLKQARHPIVEENMGDAHFIANDIDLTKGGDGGEGEGGGLILVTGPNMGGKSTYIRSAGVITLMAHIGCYVPASYAAVPITDRIFTRVGAGDNQHRAISTFMSEMLETAAIIRSATKNSLVIIDELGRGTGTTDGYGLAYAISHYLAMQLQSSCLFATHFFELTSLADEVNCVRNVHVSATTNPTSNALTFLYSVQNGTCDQSFGVDVAEMAGFPKCVVNDAKRKADELEGFDTARNCKKHKQNYTEQEEEEGLKLMREFVDKVGALPNDTAEKRKVSAVKARDLRLQLLSKKNSFVDATLAEVKCL